MATYFQKTKGCKVWDLDNNIYCDMSHMGVGTNSLAMVIKKLIEQ